MADRSPLFIAPGEGMSIPLGGFGIDFKIAGPTTGGAFAIVEHPLEPGSLAGPLHTHTNEDEFSYVIQGTMSFQVGEQVYDARPGAYIAKPRGVPHTFWNARSEPARMMEIIAPAGFERYFEELAEIIAAGSPPDVARIAALADRYGLTVHMESVPELMARHNVTLG